MLNQACNAWRPGDMSHGILGLKGVAGDGGRYLYIELIVYSVIREFITYYCDVYYNRLWEF